MNETRLDWICQTRIACMTECVRHSAIFFGNNRKNFALCLIHNDGHNQTEITL